MIEKAREENITISKIPPDVTDKIQPLDVSSFGPLKRAWTELLNERVNVLGPKEIISKSKFVNLLSQVWYTGLSTEIFPTNRDKYNIERLYQRTFNYYQHWIELEKPDDFNARIETNNEIDNEQLDKDIEEENSDDPATSSIFMENKDLANGCGTCKKIGPKPSVTPRKTFVIGWVLIDAPKEVVRKALKKLS